VERDLSGWRAYALELWVESRERVADELCARAECFARLGFAEKAEITSHRFGIGEGVIYSEKRFSTGLWLAELIVVEQLTRDGEPEHRLRVQDEATEYVLAEHELSPSSDKRSDQSSCRPDRCSSTSFPRTRGGGVEDHPETILSACP
jgi:hypothetical protein